jgi:hypothetical protein
LKGRNPNYGRRGTWACWARGGEEDGRWEGLALVLVLVTLTYAGR